MLYDLELVGFNPQAVWNLKAILNTILNDQANLFLVRKHISLVDAVYTTLSILNKYLPAH